MPKLSRAVTPEVAADKAADLRKYRTYTLAEVAPQVGVSPRTLISYIKQGRLAATKLGGRWVVTEAAIADLVNANSSVSS